LDFDDLLMQAVRLLRESTESREFWSEKFQHILIDEFQDVNQAQFEWAKLLAAKHRNICVVGDDDQSIYMWRGADVQIILDFERHYGDAQVVRLEQNYRSTQNILDAAHGVISKNFGRKPKRLWTQAGGGGRVLLHGAANAQEEALWVVRQVQLLQRERKCKLADFAILCRINAQSRPFEEAFMRARVGLKLIGTQRFYDRKEIRDLVSYLKVLYNPNDAMSLGRIINVPARGIGTTTVEKLQSIAVESGLSLYETVLHSGPEVLGRAIDLKLEGLRRVLRALQEDVKQAQTIVEVIEQVLVRTQYLESLRNEKEGRGIDRAANIEEFTAAAGDFDARMNDESWGEDAPSEGPPYLGLFLESSALDNAADKNGASDDAASLMTLHSAKGLEFPVVFMVGLEPGLLPHSRALWGEGAGPDELEEERRLCYVGMTRARETLVLSHAAQRTMHGRTENSQPSQFLDEVPNALLEKSGLASGGSMRATSTSWDSPVRQRYGPKATTGNTPVASTSTEEPRYLEPLKFSIGDRVAHPTFGEGVVVNTSASAGPGEWAEVAFLSTEVGKKKLAVSFAPLEKVA
jgi:DNA helicase-2/ATP-dependent DNA helicase PcrA